MSAKILNMAEKIVSGLSGGIKTAKDLPLARFARDRGEHRELRRAG